MQTNNLKFVPYTPLCDSDRDAQDLLNGAAIAVATGLSLAVSEEMAKGLAQGKRVQVKGDNKDV